MAYRWVLKCGDTKHYVADICPYRGLFLVYSSQRAAKMFETKQEAVDALKRRNAHPLWNRPPYQVRVVRLKLKEKIR